MDTNEVIKEFSDKINKLTYTDKLKIEKVGDEITIGWKNVLPKPPANSSNRTRKEIEYLENLTKSLTPQQRALVALVDKEPLDLFKNTISKNNLKFNEADFRKLYSAAYPVIMNLKYQYNRPRPSQLAPLYGMKVNVIETKTHQTPAYPSGHTAYTAFGAYLLSDMYPEFSNEFFRQVGVAGYARCLQGVHYPSDNEASMVISGAIWEDLRYKLFPNLYSFEKETI
jgi:acid phosphatase (class A)